MSGTRSPSPKAQATDPMRDARWSVRKLTVLFYPFAAAAVAINLFLLGLMGQAVGLTALSPFMSILWSLPLGVPAGWLAARWIRGLMDQADG